MNTPPQETTPSFPSSSASGPAENFWSSRMQNIHPQSEGNIAKSPAALSKSLWDNEPVHGDYKLQQNLQDRVQSLEAAMDMLLRTFHSMGTMRLNPRYNFQNRRSNIDAGPNSSVDNSHQQKKGKPSKFPKPHPNDAHGQAIQAKRKEKYNKNKPPKND